MIARANPIALGMTGLAIVGTLAGCAVPDERVYHDGHYEADGSYTAPSGRETISVELTLEGGVITAVSVEPHATEGNPAKFQTEFADGIAGEVLGESIAGLSVTRVAGSSLTAGGFNQALEAIKTEAAS